MNAILGSTEKRDLNISNNEQEYGSKILKNVRFSLEGIKQRQQEEEERKAEEEFWN